MYDTVVLKLLKEDIGDKYDWRSVFNKIDQTSEYKQVEGGSGHINGLRVSVTEKHVRVTGSLSKYFRGTNLDSLTLSQVEKAIKQLGKELGVPMIEADVELGGTKGTAVVLGDDFDKVSSMAVIDAAFNRQVSELDELKTVLQRLSMRQQREQELENGLYAKTMVDFQTMDQE